MSKLTVPKIPNVKAGTYRLGDRYTHDEGSVFLSGIQALARLPIEQLRVDRFNGLNTAAFVSGYQGSPLAGFDSEMKRAAEVVPDLPIICRPAVNEELAATAVMGSQLAATRPDARYDGVVGLWYGKAPGLDRACDAIRHAVFAGTSPKGGAVAIVGDDPSAKSSSLPSSSDATFVDLHMPIMYPATVQEALDMGRHAIALSRASGLWVGLKIEASVADGTSTINLNPNRIQPVMPVINGEKYECVPNAKLLSNYALEIEHELRGIRSKLAVQYASDNHLNRITIDPTDAWIGLMAPGYTYRELLEALRRLGLSTPEMIANAGIRVMKLNMPVPFNPNTIRNFARGLDELFVVEEMNPTLERWVREALYHETDRPIITGKHDPDGAPLLPVDGMLDADRMIDGLRSRLETRLKDRLAPPEPKQESVALSVNRSPYFCSGCPHNQSTRVPEGALVGAGIGCHTMALLVDDERIGDIIGLAAMGNEGAAWIGMSDFVDTDHLFQNLGDGTFFHSGQLAIQAAVSAGVNITYKLLYNGTVAMTGGQDPEGGVGVPEIVQILQAHGVAQVLITTDDVDRYRRITLPSDVAVWDRRRLIEAQKKLAAVPGVTVLIHDQPCAAESRRKRKRGKVPTPETRVAINHRICEGCGDCGQKSSCLSVEPFNTRFGRKTRINQQSCNLDFTCADGDCPSFMKAIPSKSGRMNSLLQKLQRTKGTKYPIAPIDAVPDPVPHSEQNSWSIRMAGVGGTGVVTAAQILGTAAMLSGQHVNGLDQTGLSQKAGPVISDLRLSTAEFPPPSNHLGDHQADALVAFDQLAAASPKCLAAMSRERTIVVGSVSGSPTGAMITQPTLTQPSVPELERLIQNATTGSGIWMDAIQLCTQLTGASAGANVFLLGVAIQAGAIPIPPKFLEEAIHLNGVAVEKNLAAFRWGRCFGANEGSVGALIKTDESEFVVEISEALMETVGEICNVCENNELEIPLSTYASELIDYQNSNYAKMYLDRVLTIARAELSIAPGTSDLTATVANSLYHLLAYKDEYEVARLMLDEEGLDPIANSIDGPLTASWQLHPPILRALGLKNKISIPMTTAPLMKMLAKGKSLRGTKADIFGYAAVRKVERAMIPEFQAALTVLIDNLSQENLSDAIEIAALPQQVRGFEDIKLERAASYREELAMKLKGFML